MRSIRRALSGVADAATPNADSLRLRFRISLDMLMTLAITGVAVAMAVAYQVLRRLGSRHSGTP